MSEDAAQLVPPELRDFFEKALDNACVAGFDGYFKRVSPSWTVTLGWSAEELLAKPSISFVHPEDQAATLAGRERLRGGAALGPLVNRYQCKDGSWRWFEWRSVSDMERSLVYCVARDVTAQKLAEQRLLEATRVQEQLQRQLIFAERMASVGTLAAGVAHEINNPLSFVLANLALIAEELQRAQSQGGAAPLDELAQMASDALLGAERIRKTVGALKTLSRAEQETRTVVDVERLLEQSISMTLSEIRQRARLVREYGAAPLVEVDEARLVQVFINLLVNAAQAIPEGQHTRHEIRIVTASDEEGRAVVEISDTGPGVPTAVAGRIFDPFFTTKPVGVGTGLGLAISHAIVTGLGGGISLVDGGSGATFRVVLPAAAAPAAARTVASPRAPTAPAAAARAGGSVLVVDDEPVVGAMLRRVLGSHQVTVVTAAKQALALLGSGSSFDVIISDVMMPEMSGADFYEQLVQRFPRLQERVVFVSGGAFSPSTRSFLSSTGRPLIEKPFEPEVMRAVVQGLVARRLPPRPESALWSRDDGPGPP